jgi:DNA mismatch repair protein MutL
MVKKIAVLRSDVINQIAAGEVLENPASAVKELVENAIDAGALRICVEIKGGGHQLIRVEDDGVGMGREDALGCLERHATSKIRQTDDLLYLSTMGFRGEALAAIASVSQMELLTMDGEESSRLEVEAGKVVTVEPCARNRGTTIDVRALFYNVPARQKFQKSVASSGALVLKTLQTIALAQPEISFTLVSQERVVFQVDAKSDWRERAKEVLGSFAHEVKGEKGGYIVRGLLGSPDGAKGNRSGQYVFLNKRPIFSPVIARAIKDGYSTRLPEGRHASVVLYLELPPDEFDVNVHPQKRDVRFQDESKVYRLVERAVAEAFGSSPELIFPSPLEFKETILPWDVEPRTSESNLGDFQPPLFSSSLQTKKAAALIGSLALFEGDPCILLDLKGAEARLLFENMQRETPHVQTLLLPYELHLSVEEAREVFEWVNELKRLGVEARLLGNRLLAIDALPVGLEVDEMADFFSQWKAEKKIASMICRLCRSRKKIYSLEEAAFIEQKLSECKDSKYDPLGRVIRKEIREEQMIEWLSYAT